MLAAQESLSTSFDQQGTGYSAGRVVSARAAIAVGKLPEAVDAANAAVSEDESSLDARLVLARAHMLAGRSDRAAEHFELANAAAPLPLALAEEAHVLPWLDAPMMPGASWRLSRMLIGMIRRFSAKFLRLTGVWRSETGGVGCPIVCGQVSGSRRWMDLISRGGEGQWRVGRGDRSSENCGSDCGGKLASPAVRRPICAGNRRPGLDGRDRRPTVEPDA